MGISMSHEQAVGRFYVNRQTELFYRALIPNQHSLILVFIHGAGQHSGQFVEFGRCCLQHNIAFYAFDLRGFGRSTGKRGHVHSFYEYLDDIDKFIAFIRRMHPDEPIFLLGHSLGGTIVVRYGQEYQNQVQGAILSAPALRLRYHIPKLVYRVCHTLSFITPGMSMELNRWCDLVTRILRTSFNPKIAEDNDPLSIHQFSIRWLTELLDNGNYALKQAKKFQVAALCLCGTDDPIVDPKAVQEFHDALQVEDKKCILLQATHRLLQGDGKELIYKNIIHWLKERI